MSPGTIFGLIGCMLAVGSTIVTITTKFNCVASNKKAIEKNEKRFDEFVKKTDSNFKGVWHRMDEMSDSVSFIKGKLNNQ